MTVTLAADEARVLGTLIEKAQTTPNQYPLTLNSLVTGINQKNNRWPVVTIDEERALRALDTLRAKGLVREVALSGSRVEKFRHVAREALEVSTHELVILAELWLRGPQTVGELRGRASRMHPFESLEVAENVLQSLAKREPPFVRELPPAPGSRAGRWVQLLAPNLHPLDSHAPSSGGDDGDHAPSGGEIGALAARVSALEAELAAIKKSLGI